MSDEHQYESFKEAIGFKNDWPTHEPDSMSIVGHTKFCSSYLQASENAFFFEETEYPMMHLMGPVLQLSGLSAELTLKTILKGYGASDSELKKYGHNTYELYLESRSAFDEVKFINNSMHQSAFDKLPEIVQKRILAQSGVPPTNSDWNVFFQHLRLLDEMYDRPFRSRYITAGEANVPEPYFIILGVKTLLAAMHEILGIERLPGSQVQT